MTLAGQAREEFGDRIKVDIVYKGFLMIGGPKDIPKPPQFQVGPELLGPSPTYEEVRQAVRRQLPNE